MLICSLKKSSEIEMRIKAILCPVLILQVIKIESFLNETTIKKQYCKKYYLSSLLLFRSIYRLSCSYQVTVSTSLKTLIDWLSLSPFSFFALTHLGFVCLCRTRAVGPAFTFKYPPVNGLPANNFR